MKKFQDARNVLSVIKNVAIYARKSRGDSEGDLEKHILIMKELCEQNNWTYVLYPEIGSGESIADREKIQELLLDVEQEMYDAVLVFDYDRLGRGSGGDQDRINYTFRKSDSLIIIANPFEILDPNDERDEETIEFKGFLARREYKNITKRLTSGRKIALKMGRWAIGAAPFGYSYDAELKGLIPNIEEAEIYQKLIVKAYLDGKSTYEIVEELNLRRIPSPRKNLWSDTTVRNLLRSEVYLGNIVYNKSEGIRESQTKSLTKKPFKQKPKSEWVVVENCHKALKTHEEHSMILEIMKSRNSPRSKSNIYALSGIIQCFNCKNTMHIQKDGDRTIIKKCRNCGESKGGDIELAYEAIYDSVSNLRKVLIDMKSNYSDNREKTELLNEISNIENQISLNRKAIERIEEAYENGLYDADKTKNKIKERQQQNISLENELKTNKEKLKSFTETTNEDRIKRIDSFLREIKSPKNQKAMNKIYKELVASVIWERTETYSLKVTVNFL